jgi:hypothetical protein
MKVGDLVRLKHTPLPIGIIVDEIVANAVVKVTYLYLDVWTLGGPARHADHLWWNVDDLELISEGG